MTGPAPSAKITLYLKNQAECHIPLAICAAVKKRQRGTSTGMKPYMLLPRVLAMICGLLGLGLIFSIIPLIYYHSALALGSLPLAGVLLFLALFFYRKSRKHLIQGKYLV